jgi:hypothetical protein
VDVGEFSIYLAKTVKEEKFAVLCWLCLEEKRHFICVGLWDKIWLEPGNQSVGDSWRPCCTL